jgi:hypothetical protein
MRPTKASTWIKGLKNAYSQIGATQRDQYSWMAQTNDAYVFSAEIDHLDSDNNIYRHNEGTFVKHVLPKSTISGDDPNTVTHSKELFEAVMDAYANKLKCRMLLVKGTKYGSTKGGVKASIDGDIWQITDFHGNVENGYYFNAERVESKIA